MKEKPKMKQKENLGTHRLIIIYIDNKSVDPQTQKATDDQTAAITATKK